MSECKQRRRVRLPLTVLLPLLAVVVALLVPATPVAARPADTPTSPGPTWLGRLLLAAAEPAPAARSRPAPLSVTLPRRSGKGKRVVYSISRQRVWLVGAGGRLRRTYLVSGQLSQPGPGSYRVYSRSRHTSSAVSDATMGFMVRFAHGRRTGAAIGFHDIPRGRHGRLEQALADLGKPLSAGCVRQARPHAKALWAFAPVGTKVVVLR